MAPSGLVSKTSGRSGTSLKSVRAGRVASGFTFSGVRSPSSQAARCKRSIRRSSSGSYRSDVSVRDGDRRGRSRRDGDARLRGLDLPVKAKHLVREWISKDRPFAGRTGTLELSDVVVLRVPEPAREVVAEAEAYAADRDRLIVSDPRHLRGPACDRWDAHPGAHGGGASRCGRHDRRARRGLPARRSARV